MTAPELWAWAPHEDSEEWSSPFATREEAMEHGRDSAKCDLTDEYQEFHADGHVDCGGSVLGVVAECAQIDPAGEAGRRAGWLAEDLVERMNDDDEIGGAFDDLVVFTLKPGAEDALRAVLEPWAAQYIAVTPPGAFLVTGQAEPVTLPESK